MKITYEELVKVKKTVTISLKPCPCCGAKAAFKFTSAHRQGEWNSEGGAAITCTNRECKISTPFKSNAKNRIEVSEMWNRREI